MDGVRLGREQGAAVLHVGRHEIWFYRGRSFNFDGHIQRMRIGRTCGFVQIAYGHAIHHGLPARRTIGISIA